MRADSTAGAAPASVAHIDDLQRVLDDWRRQGRSIGFVPTMGNLHNGHMSLIELAQRSADRTVVSIYVNPLQFGMGEDFAGYPRTPDEDCALLAGAGVDVLFSPLTEEIYPLGQARITRVDVPELSGILCGAVRPGHFVGVATVVTKLLNIVRPDIAVFGEKDFQQLTIVRRVVKDLCMPVTIIGAPTGREPDGLAMSSRNRYLTAAERRLAPVLYARLIEVRDAIRAGDRDYPTLQGSALQALRARGFRTDYFEVREAGGLEPPRADSAELVVLAAAWLGRARLIDNVRV
ncbi:MAG TPA: pantoate--beta-alanine ligase [Gammaproteobacteria bacterium]|nr:pantoate--beta-alanine ligase [Gammaproteobacteria bacterium]